MLEARDVSAGYGRVMALRGASLKLEEREIVAVLGRNGMGKTTFLRSLIGQLPARSGHILFEGNDVTRLPAYKRARLGLGYVPQGRHVFPRLTVRENLLAAAYAGKSDKAVVSSLLADIPVLGQKQGAYAGDLSGGQQQLLAIARALALEPRALLLDEPSEGVQPSFVEEIFDLVSRVRDERGVSVIVVEQNMEFATALADRAVLMRNGETVLEVHPSQVMQDDALHHEYLGV
jgi:urea transport system ATP-binding protein